MNKKVIVSLSVVALILGIIVTVFFVALEDKEKDSINVTANMEFKRELKQYHNYKKYEVLKGTNRDTKKQTTFKVRLDKKVIIQVIYDKGKKIYMFSEV